MLVQASQDCGRQDADAGQSIDHVGWLFEGVSLELACSCLPGTDGTQQPSRHSHTDTLTHTWPTTVGEKARERLCGTRFGHREDGSLRFLPENRPIPPADRSTVLQQRSLPVSPMPSCNSPGRSSHSHQQKQNVRWSTWTNGQQKAVQQQPFKT